MNYKQSLELQIRTATERLIIVPPSEQSEYLSRIARLAGSLAKEKRAPRNGASGVVTAEFHGGMCW